MRWKGLVAVLALIVAATTASASPVEKPVDRTGDTGTAMKFLTALRHQDIEAAGLLLGKDAVLDLQPAHLPIARSRPATIASIAGAATTFFVQSA